MELPSRDTTTAPPSLATSLDSARHLRHASGTAPLGRDNPVNYSQPHPREAKFTRVTLPESRKRRTYDLAIVCTENLSSDVVVVKSAKDGVLGTIPHRLSHFICVNFSDVSNIDHVSGTGHEMMELSPHRTRHLSVTESAARSCLYREQRHVLLSSLHRRPRRPFR